MYLWKQASLVLTVAATACLLSLTLAEAKKPGGGPGGGGSAYTILPFAPLGTASRGTYVYDLNDMGEVIGTADSSNGETTCWYLDLITGDYTQLPYGTVAINNMGQIVGETPDRVGYILHGVSADAVYLPPLAGDDESIPLDINDDGVIVGISKVGGTSQNTVVAWWADVDSLGAGAIHGPIALSPLGDATDSGVFRVNDPVEGGPLVVGQSWSPGAAREAVVWSLSVNAEGELLATEPIGLGTLGIFNPDVSYSEGFGINGYGDVCGRSDAMPYLFPAGGEMEALPVPSGTYYAFAYDVNDSSQVVGFYEIFYQKGANVVRKE